MDQQIADTIFRALDIRGKTETDLDDAAVAAIGKAFGTYVVNQGGSSVYAGYDNRASSPGLADAFIAGVVSTGCKVSCLGMGPTPAVYFASSQEDNSFGAIITASHLPAAWNGIKFCQGGKTLYPGAIKEIAVAETFTAGTGERIEALHVVEQYADYLYKQFKESITGSTVVIDCQNGAASVFAPAVFKRFDIAAECIHCDPAEPYPFEKPDPQNEANLLPLSEHVKALKASCGIAFDGDADRLGVIDDQGRFISADRILALYARDVLSNHPGAVVICDILCSQIPADETTRLGGEAIIWRSGHTFIKEKLAETGAMLAGESSGHMFFADRYFGYDDGVYAALRLIELLAAKEQMLSDLLATLPQMYTTPEQRPHCPDDLKFKLVDEVRDYFTAEGYDMTTVDGVRIYFENGWGLVRSSNTEPVLSIRFEAGNEQDLQAYHDLVWEKVTMLGREHGAELKP
jgi:phosphomannomutase/phosphoglucomutase